MNKQPLYVKVNHWESLWGGGGGLRAFYCNAQMAQCQGSSANQLIPPIAQGKGMLHLAKGEERGRGGVSCLWTIAFGPPQLKEADFATCHSILLFSFSYGKD